MFTDQNPLRMRFASKCNNCGLDYSAFNVGDGPAALLIIPITTLIIIMAIWLDMAADPPFWAQVIIWVPVTTVITFASIRITKAALLILEHRRGAGEGISNGPDESGDSSDA